MDQLYLVETGDAVVWAREFVSLFTVSDKDGSLTTGDAENLMTTWFANAMMAGDYDAPRREQCDGRPGRRIPHPGRRLGHEIKAQGWTQKHLAHLINRPEQCISEVVRGKKRITPRLAIELGEVLGTSAEYWWHLEAAYDLQEARYDATRRASTAMPDHDR